MATYEMYKGGPRQQNTDFAMYPVAPFSQNNPTLPAANKVPIYYGNGITYNFGFDPSIQNFMSTLVANGTPLASGDKFGAAVIPARSLFVGVWWSVNVPQTGLSFSLIQRIASTTLLSSTSAGTAGDGFALANSGVPVYLSASDIIDLDFATIPAGGVGNLSITVAPLFASFLPFGENS